MVGRVAFSSQYRYDMTGSQHGTDMLLSSFAAPLRLVRITPELFATLIRVHSNLACFEGDDYAPMATSSSRWLNVPAYGSPRPLVDENITPSESDESWDLVNKRRPGGLHLCFSRSTSARNVRGRVGCSDERQHLDSVT